MRARSTRTSRRAAAEKTARNADTAKKRAEFGNEAIEHDRDKFVEATERVHEVVEMLENLGTKDGKDGDMIAKDWKFQARSLVRTFLGRTKGAFEDEPEYEKLKDLVAELR